MPEDDIYGNKKTYEQFIANLELFLIPPAQRTDKRGRRSIYYCKNRKNLNYFYQLCKKFDAKDLSYVRRCRVLNSFRLICHATEKDLMKCERDDIDGIVAFMHTRYHSPKSKSDFIKDLKCSWKLLFPETDERGRIDDIIMPYAVRHLKATMDKSREKARKDKLTWEEFKALVNYFADAPQIQAFLTLALESLGRPQEILYTRLRSLELYDDYAKVHISEHGKEGIGFLQCIDAFPYLMKWYQQHPLKHDQDAFVFLNANRTQLKPKTINNLIKQACRRLQINKPITCYSFKRNGVTFARLRGESDVEIQHKARWTSTKQLKTYDLSTQEDSFRKQLAKRGLLQDAKHQHLLPQTKACPFCGFGKIGYSEDTCPRCHHIIDKTKLRQTVRQEQDKLEQIQDLFKLNQVVQQLQREIKELKGN